MPYKSDAQRRFFHSAGAKKAGITEDEVKEFDQASKGKKLPERKMNEGGEVEKPTEMKDDDFTKGIKEGFSGEINSGIDYIKGFLKDTPKKYHEAMGDNGNLKGLQHIADEKAKGYAYGGETNPKHETLIAMQNNPTAGFADGGDVPPQPFPAGGYPGAGANNAREVLKMIATGGTYPILPGSDLTNNLATSIGNGLFPPQPVNVNDIPPPSAPLAPTPLPQAKPSPLGATQPINQIPDTDYSLYHGINAEDRAKLYQNLLAQKASAPNMAASGAAGLGDAIVNSFGRGGANYQQNLAQNMAKNNENIVAGVDTERQQKLQDIQGSIALQEADPNSPYSQGMRQFLRSQGMKVPSGMSAAMLKQTLPDVTKIFDAHMQAATQAGAQGAEIGKTLMGETLWSQFKDAMGLGGGAEKGKEYLESRISGAKPASTNGWRVVR